VELGGGRPWHGEVEGKVGRPVARRGAAPAEARRRQGAAPAEARGRWGASGGEAEAEPMREEGNG
jgi:hypothetical protein